MDLVLKVLKALAFIVLLAIVGTVIGWYIEILITEVLCK